MRRLWGRCLHKNFTFKGLSSAKICSHIDSVVCWGGGSSLPTRKECKEKTRLEKWPDKGKTERLGSSSVEGALVVFVESELNKSQLCSLTAKWPTKPVWTEVQPGEWHTRLGWVGCVRRKLNPVFPWISRSWRNKGTVHVYLISEIEIKMTFMMQLYIPRISGRKLTFWPTTVPRMVWDWCFPRYTQISSMLA